MTKKHATEVTMPLVVRTDGTKTPAEIRKAMRRIMWMQRAAVPKEVRSVSWRQ